MRYFYKEKKQAYAIIEFMIPDKEAMDNIYFKISTEFGFGKRFVDDRIAILEKVTKNVPRSTKKR